MNSTLKSGGAHSANGRVSEDRGGVADEAQAAGAEQVQKYLEKSHTRKEVEVEIVRPSVQAAIASETVLASEAMAAAKVHTKVRTYMPCANMGGSTAVEQDMAEASNKEEEEATNKTYTILRLPAIGARTVPIAQKQEDENTEEVGRQENENAREEQDEANLRLRGGGEGEGVVSPKVEIFRKIVENLLPCFLFALVQYRADISILRQIQVAEVAQLQQHLAESRDKCARLEQQLLFLSQTLRDRTRQLEQSEKRLALLQQQQEHNKSGERETNVQAHKKMHRHSERMTELYLLCQLQV
jgi:hypothetical protein